MEEPKENIAAPLLGAEFWRKDVGMTERFVGLVVVVSWLATEAVIETFANDSAEGLSEFFLTGEDEVLSGEDSCGIQPNFGSRVDAAELGEFEVE